MTRPMIPLPKKDVYVFMAFTFFMYSLGLLTGWIVFKLFGI